MIEPLPTEHPDDEILIDFSLGLSAPEQAEQVRQRLTRDETFASRADKVAMLLSMLDRMPAEEPSEELTARTLASVASARRTTALLDREAALQRNVIVPSFSLRELGAIAAMLLLVGLIMVPSLRQAQQLSTDQACLSQVGQIGTALLHYANDNDGYLPGLQITQAAWLADGPAPVRVSNSRNLWQLIRSKYAGYALFQCPAGSVQPYTVSAQMSDFPSGEVIGYSYHNSVNCKPLNVHSYRRSAASMAILGDRTPVFSGGKFAAERMTCQNSDNHGGRGQAVLYLDRHAAWTNNAEVGYNGDNIWLAEGVSAYQGVEKPAHEHDSFLLPNFVLE